MTPEDLLNRIHSGRNVPFLLDVRQPEEIKGELGQVPGAINIPLGRLFARLQEIPMDRDVVFITRSGQSALLAQLELKKQGYARLFNLQGGMLALRACEAKPQNSNPPKNSGAPEHVR